MFAYKAKNAYVMYKVPKNLRRTSSKPSSLNFKLSQGAALLIMYQRVASAEYLSIVANGSTPLPRRLDILFPFLSKTNPLETTFLNAIDPRTMVEIACRVKNQPRVWSTPSAMKSAGNAEKYSSLKGRASPFSNLS